MQNSLIGLNKLKNNQTGLIVSIKPSQIEFFQELTALGITPYTFVKIIHNDGRYIVFKVDRKEFAADMEISSAVMVQTFG